LEQHSALLEQRAFVDVHGGSMGFAPAGGPQTADEPEQPKLQHSALVVQSCPSPRHGIWQVDSPSGPGKHSPLQQSLLCAHRTPNPAQVLVENAQRPRVASHVLLQQLMVEPLPHGSPEA